MYMETSSIIIFWENILSENENYHSFIQDAGDKNDTSGGLCLAE